MNGFVHDEAINGLFDLKPSNLAWVRLRLRHHHRHHHAEQQATKIWRRAAWPQPDGYPCDTYWTSGLPVIDSGQAMVRQIGTGQVPERRLCPAQVRLRGVGDASGGPQQNQLRAPLCPLAVGRDRRDFVRFWPARGDGEVVEQMERLVRLAQAGEEVDDPGSDSDRSSWWCHRSCRNPPGYGLAMRVGLLVAAPLYHFANLRCSPNTTESKEYCRERAHNLPHP